MMLKNKMNSMALIVIACILLINCVYAAESKAKQIVCLGDEITHGNWREEMIGNGTRWVDVLASYNNNMEVINAGVNGMKAGDVQYLESVLAQYPDADMYILYFGINDIKRIQSIDPAGVASVGAKMLRMVRRIKEVNENAEIALIAPQRVSFENASEEQRAAGVTEFTPVLSDMIDGSYALVAKREGIRLIELVDKLDSELLADGVYPNIAGHAKIAEIVWDEITHPYMKQNDNLMQVKMAPPPAGKPVMDSIGTESLVEAVSGDLEEMNGVGSAVEYAEADNNYKARAKTFVDEKQSEGIITKDAYMLGKGIGSQLIAKAEGILIKKVDSIMNMELTDSERVGGSSVEVCEISYELPESSRVESYITDIEVDSEGYETLAEAVDWGQVKIENEVVSEELAEVNDKADDNQKAIVDKVDTYKDIVEVAENDIITDNKEITEVWLPELEVMTVEVESDAVELAELDKAEEMVEKMTDNDVKEVFAAAEPIEYTGYEVMIHTGIEE